MSELIRLSWLRTRIELRRSLRQKDELIGTFMVPLLLLVLFTSILGGELGDTGVDFSSYFVAGIIGSVTVSLGYQNLAAVIVNERYSGTLKLLSATPMPRAAYFLGKIGHLLISATAQIALMLVAGVLFADVSLPDSPGKWFTFVWVFLMGLTACGLAGVAITRLITHPRSVTAVTLPAYLVLSFISGVYFVQTDLPSWLQAVAGVFPLRWITLGIRSAFLPDSFAAVETGGSWQLGRVFVVLAVWIVAMGVVAVRSFRWTQKR